MNKPAKTPVTIVTGFLGSGKTSFLARLLALDNFSRAAIIINEFGEHSLDHLLVDHVEEQTFELPGGCLCCNARGNLVEKMLQLDTRKNQDEVNFDRLVIETSGVANTENLASTLWSDPQIRSIYRLEKVVTIVSATEWQNAFANNNEFARQLAVSDIIFISKADLLDDKSRSQTLGQLEMAITAINNDARISVLPLSHSELNEVIGSNIATRSRYIPEKPGTHDTAAFKSLSLTHTNPISQIAIEDFMDFLLSRHSSSLLRVKGLVLTVENPDAPMVVQAVGLINSPVTWLEYWHETPVTRLIVIHTGNIGDKIVSLFNSMLDVPMPDQPDNMALTENPLSITGQGKFDP